MDKYKDLDDQALSTLATEKKDAFDALIAVESPTVAQVDEAKELAAERRDIATEQKSREEAAAEAGKTWADLKTEFSEESAEESGEDEGDEDEEGADDAEEGDEGAEAEGAEGTEAAAETAEKGKEKASARGKTVATLARKTKRPAAPSKVTENKGIVITAAADVPGYSASQGLNSLEEVAKAVINRAKAFSRPSGDGTREDLHQFGTAHFELDFPEDLVVDRMEDAQEVMHRAADESRLPGGSLRASRELLFKEQPESLVAAGGWCAPSETVYDLSQDATTEGMLSIPEVAVRRGGIRYAQSPVFSAFYANPGFIQTETQAIAGTTKPCVEVPCPTFTEVRLDAEGICIKVPILTNVGYPEAVSNFVAGTMVAHQHWINANVIGRLVTAAGAARVITGLGSSVSDTVEALGLVIDQTRQKYRLSFNATVEVVVPFWVKNALKADLGRRNGRDKAAVSDQELNAWFSAIGANVQYVYDWQAIDETVEVYPATFQALVYPAGTFVKGTSPIISLNTVYDAASLAVNTYTGLFAEQGLLVAKMKFHADLLTLPICNAGRQGALDLVCA